MLYYGQFSFSYTSQGSSGPEPWHGFFPVLLKARNVNEAVAKCRRLIRRLRNQGTLPDEVEEIYLETLAAVRTMPPSGLVPYLALMDGKDVGGMFDHGALAPEDSLQLYGWGEKPPDNGEDAAYERTPFVTFKDRLSTKTVPTATNSRRNRKAAGKGKRQAATANSGGL